MAKKRDRLEVIHDIAHTIMSNKNACNPTKILYKSNLSHQMMQQYFDFMIEKGFITMADDGKGKIYSLTDKGFEYLEKYKIIKEFTESFDL